MFNIIKRSVFIILFITLATTLAFCKKEKKYLIKNDNNKYLSLLTTDNKEIPVKDYKNNLFEEIKVKLNLKEIKPKDTQLIRKFSLNDKVYEFSPLDKEYQVKLLADKVNEFKATKEDRKTLNLTYNANFFEVLKNNIEIKEPNPTALEGDKITINTKNLPQDMQVVINGESQVKIKDITFQILTDTEIIYKTLGQKADDKEIIENQLKNLNLALKPGDSLNNLRYSFKLPELSDKTMTLEWSLDKEHSSILINKEKNTFTIKDDFVGETPLKLTAKITRNNLSATKEFDLIVKEKPSTETLITAELLEELLTSNNYFLKFRGADNAKSVSEDIDYNNPYEADGYELSYEFSSDYLKNDVQNKKFILTKTNYEDISVEVVVKLKKDSIEVKKIISLNIIKTIKTIKSEVEISKTIDLEDCGKINDKKVSRMVLLSNPGEIITHTKKEDKGKFNGHFKKFIFNQIGSFRLLYKVYYKDETEEELYTLYEVSYPKKYEFKNNYTDNLLNNINKFREYKDIKSEEKQKIAKTVGVDNAYLPDIKFEYDGKKLSNDQTRFNPQRISTYIKYDRELFKITIKDDNNQVMGEELYTVSGSKIMFKEQTNDEKIYEITYEHKNIKNDSFKEYVKVKKGVNAYEDEELRTYFRELTKYENIYLQRSLKIQEHQEVVKKLTLPNGKEITYRDYNQNKGNYKVSYYDENNNFKENEEHPLFDSEGNITRAQRYFQGSVFYRYFDKKGSLKDKYLPVKFNGNFYTVDVSGLSFFCHHTYDGAGNLDIEQVPDIQAAVFDIFAPNGYALDYKKVNEIKNIQILGNGGIAGESIEYGGGKSFSKLSGSMTCLRLRNARAKYSNITTRNNNNLIYAMVAEADFDYIDAQNNFSYHIYFRNRMPSLELDYPKDFITPMTRIRLTNSYLGDCGSFGITCVDGDKRYRYKGATSEYFNKLSDNKYEFNQTLHDKLAKEKYKYEYYDVNDPEERYKYSADPTVEVENCDLKCFVSTKSSLIKQFNVEEHVNKITDLEPTLKGMGLNVIKKDGNDIKINAPFLLMNNNVLGLPQTRLYNDKGELNTDFLNSHADNRGEFILDGKRDYPRPNMQYDIRKENLDKFKSQYVLITGLGEEVDKSPTLNGSVISDAALANGSHLLPILEKQSSDRNKVVKLLPVADLPILNGEKGRLNLYAFFGYDKI